MQKYLDSVGVLTLVVMLPLCLGTVYGYIQNDITFSEYISFWKEPMLLLVGFWLRGASAGSSTGSSTT